MFKLFTEAELVVILKNGPPIRAGAVAMEMRLFEYHVTGTTHVRKCNKLAEKSLE